MYNLAKSTKHCLWIPFQKNIYLHLLFIFVEFLKKCELLGNHATTNATENKKITYNNIETKHNRNKNNLISNNFVMSSQNIMNSVCTSVNANSIYVKLF